MLLIHPIHMIMATTKKTIALLYWQIDRLQLVLRSFSGLFLSQVFLASSSTEVFLVALLRIFSFSCLFPAFSFPAINLQSSMVLWAMVNFKFTSIVAKILNTRSTGLFEEDIVIASCLNKLIFGNSLRWYTKNFPHISWYCRCMNNSLIVVWSEPWKMFFFSKMRESAPTPPRTSRYTATFHKNGYDFKLIKIP